MYSSDFDEALGPVVTTFAFTPHDSYEPLGGIRAIGSKRKYDALWGGEYTYFKKKATYHQRIKVHEHPVRLDGLCRYQVCTDQGKCILLEEAFSFADFLTVKAASPAAPSGIRSPPARATTEPADEEPPAPVGQQGIGDDVTDDVSSPRLSDEKKLATASASAARPEKEDSLWGFFVLSLLAGLAALLTPCVFPLIPMTVSYFTKQKNLNKQHIAVYGTSIVLIYTIIGFVVTPLMGPEVANELATGWLPNLLFFLVLLAFGLSFLGMFEMRLPSSWANFANKKSDKGGLIGIFFMSLTLVLVTFSCTGPIVGSVLVQAAGGQFLMPVVGMMGYSFAFAFPFTFFAIFPKWLSSLPKSGEWLNTVKVSLGFLEIALSIKFLSVADQVYHWGLLDREIYIAIWIAVFSFFGLYLLGKLNLPGDSPLKKIPVPRLMLSMAVFTFVIYLVPGLFGAPLKALSGYLPPQTTQDFDLTRGTRVPTLRGAQNETADALCDAPRYADILKIPHGIQGYFEYEQAIACAKKRDKPLFIDFTGHGCVNCREMEARVWSHPEVLKRLKNNFVLVALYVDERRALPEAAWYVSSYDKKMKKTLGRKNADLQITRYNNNAQPFYVILGRDEELLLPPRAYDLDIAGFIAFLDEGVARFNDRPQEAGRGKGL